MQENKVNQETYSEKLEEARDLLKKSVLERGMF